MSRTRILIVDDEAHIRNVVGAKLSAAGYDVSVAIDGQDAYELALRTRPELVVTDLQMPRMTGLEWCLKLRGTDGFASTPVVMLTSRGDILSKADHVAAGIVHLLDKPFSPRRLVMLIESLRAPSTAAA